MKRRSWSSKVARGATRPGRVGGRGLRALGWVAAASLTVLGCGRGADSEQGGRGQPGASAAASTSSPGESDWRKNCGQCHRRQELVGRKATEIRAAMDEVPRMNKLRGRFTDAQLQDIERYLADP